MTSFVKLRPFGCFCLSTNLDSFVASSRAARYLGFPDWIWSALSCRYSMRPLMSTKWVMGMSLLVSASSNT